MLFFSMHFYFHIVIFGKKKPTNKNHQQNKQKNPVLFQCPLPTNIPLNRAHVFLLIQTGSGDEDKML